MDFPVAMATVREITPHARAAPLVCAEFSQGRGYTNWRPRGTPDWLLIYTVAGAGRIVTASDVVELTEGRAVLYCPHAPQEYATDPAAGNWSLRWAHFVAKPHWQPWLIWPEIDRGTAWVNLSAGAASRFSDALNRMILTSRLGGDGASDLAMNALVEALLWAHRDVAGDRLLRLDPRIRRAVAYLAAHPARPFSLPEVAAHCGLSASRFSHLFRQELQTAPRQFSEKLRLELAEQLLAHTGLSVREVASEAGFEDPLYFSRRFTRARGRTPVAFREEFRSAGKAAQPS
jgi:AraC family transcriptional regulator of arabinose operon